MADLYTTSGQLHPFTWGLLRARDPSEAAANALAKWDGDSYRLPFLGGVLAVSPSSGEVFFEGSGKRTCGYQEALPAVLYLASAAPAPASGEFVSPRELPGGQGFFRGPHVPPSRPIEKRFGKNPAELVKTALASGWSPSPEGDAGVFINALPKIPLKIILWGEAEDMGSSATILVDSGAHRHLPLDAVWALMNAAVARLCLSK